MAEQYLKKISKNALLKKQVLPPVVMNTTSTSVRFMIALLLISTFGVACDNDTSRSSVPMVEPVVEMRALLAGIESKINEYRKIPGTRSIDTDEALRVVERMERRLKLPYYEHSNILYQRINALDDSLTNSPNGSYEAAYSVSVYLDDIDNCNARGGRAFIRNTKAPDCNY